jgi:GNAT superfamily N-acetyltransferase
LPLWRRGRLISKGNERSSLLNFNVKKCRDCLPDSSCIYIFLTIIFSTMNELIIAQAVKVDLPIILDIQRKAFIEVAMTFNLKSMPQIEQTLESLNDEFINCTILKASIVNTIVGSVRAYNNNDTCFISKLIVLPENQNRGIGKALMKAIENKFRNIVRRYELFTGARDPRNLYLYDQLGYKSFKTEKYNNVISYVYMEKALYTPDKPRIPEK